MAWQRKIPFGYRIENGLTVLHPNEAYAVKRIFDSYTKGESYLAIAAAMTDSGIRYHAATPEWNKNMVKRILENGRYTGEGGWPEIISINTFNIVAAMRMSKTDGWREHPVCNKTVKRKLACGVCGTLFRTQNSLTNDVRYLRCGNEECGVRLTITDAGLEQRITALLNRLAIQPELLDMQYSAAPLSLESERIQNELNRELGKADWDEDYATSLAFACAAERYGMLGNMDCLKQKADTLQTRLPVMEPITAFDSSLFNEAVETVLAGADGALALKLISGNIISENESGEVIHHADAVTSAVS